MELSEIKSSMLGYSKKSVCQYISELNTLHEAELQEQKSKADKRIENNNAQIKHLSDNNASLTEEVKSLKEEIEGLRLRIAELEGVNSSLNQDYEALTKETEDLRAKSDVISTAIINAEKCASSMINEANNRAKDMINEAHVKVEDETQRLETAKQYITEVRGAVETALRKIEAELSDIESDISYKSQEVLGERKPTVKEKFGILDKTFKRA